MTNADKIRAMTDEELLYLLMRVADGNTPTSISLHRDYDDGYKKWLRNCKGGLTMADYISREAASDLLEMALSDDWEPEYAQDRLSEIPAADVVTREAFNRILAENDIMREQLAKIGKKPGDSMTGIQMLTCCCCDGSKVVEIDQIKEDA